MPVIYNDARKKYRVDLITYVILNFSSLEPSIGYSIIWCGFWDSISHFTGEPSVKTICVSNRIKKGIKNQG